MGIYLFLIVSITLKPRTYTSNGGLVGPICTMWDYTNGMFSNFLRTFSLSLVNYLTCDMFNFFGLWCDG